MEVDATVVLLNSPAAMVDMEQVQDHQTHHQSDKVMMVEMIQEVHIELEAEEVLGQLVLMALALLVEMVEMVLRLV